MSHQGTPKRLSRADFYNLISGKIDHQDDLVNQRTVWLVVSEAFFFMAFVTLVNAPPGAEDQYADQRTLLYWLIPIAGLLAGLFTYAAVLSSLAHIRQLNGLMDYYQQQSPEEDASATDFPPIQGSRVIRHTAKISPVCLPLVFIVTWIIILLW